MPSAASPATLAQARALYDAFTPWTEIARITGIKQATIERRAMREKWAPERAEQQRNCMPIAVDSSESWLVAMRRDCENSLVRLRTYPIPTSIDLEMKRERLISALDERARRAYGIDKQGNSLQVNLNFMRDQPKSLQGAQEQRVIDVGTVKPDSQSDA